MLAPTHLESWRRGRIDFLERVIQGNLQKISEAMKYFRQWAEQKGLQPSETRYRHRSFELRFSKSGDPGIEKSYRTHYISPALAERKKERIEENLSRPAQPVIFEIVRDSQCSECGAELCKGSFLFMEAERPLCLPCAKMDDLEFLPSGDTALTRRTSKYGARTAVVVRFSRSRGRYERQGILAEKAALAKAEEECSEDAEQRARERAAGTERRRKEDRELVDGMTAEIEKLFPGCPPREAAAIAAYTAVRNSGREGRTAAGRSFDEGALMAAVKAAVRHKFTLYDGLLMSGLDRDLARNRVADKVEEILAAWGEQRFSAR